MLNTQRWTRRVKSRNRLSSRSSSATSRGVVHMRGASLLAACVCSTIAGHILLAQQLPLEPAKQFGTSITGVFEGWFDNPDGSHSFLVGYLNRNRNRAIDLPVGPNNRIEP